MGENMGYLLVQKTHTCLTPDYFETRSLTADDLWCCDECKQIWHLNGMWHWVRCSQKKANRLIQREAKKRGVK